MIDFTIFELHGTTTPVQFSQKRQANPRPSPTFITSPPPCLETQKTRPLMVTENADAGGVATSDELTAVKDLRLQLEDSIESRRLSQQDLVSSLQALVPNLVSSLDLSLQLILAFNRRPFALTPNPNPNPNPNPDSRHRPNNHLFLRCTHPKPSFLAVAGDRMSVVRTMVAVDMALRRISKENGGVQFEDFTVNGRRRCEVGGDMN